MSLAKGAKAVVRLRPDCVGTGGEALADLDGIPVHVFGGIPGEQVIAQVVRQHRHHLAAEVVEVVDPSAQRVNAPCPFFGECTGCQWQHVTYEHQLELKLGMVQEAMNMVAGIRGAVVSPVIAANESLGYRNHARFSVGPGGVLGFINRESRRFVHVDRCLLMHPWINETLSRLQGHCDRTAQVSLRYGVGTGQWLLQPALGAEAPVESGQKSYEEALLGRRFCISASSFFQVNTTQAGRMIELLRDRLALRGDELVVDAYAGVGTFAVLLAPYSGEVLAIEDSAAAVRDAQANIQGLANVSLVRARTEEWLGKFLRVPDALVLDPPRSGCHPLVLQALQRRPPRRLVYVSCDPWSLARDLKVLLRGPFALEEVQPIDVFPQTHHIECIATMSFDAARHHAFVSRQEIILASGSPRRQQIMTEMGIAFRVIPSGVDEEPGAPSNDPVAIAVERAVRKARSVAAGLSSGIVIGADTIVAFGSDIMGKPVSAEEARDFLRLLRGREHRVITGLALVNAASGEAVTGYRRSRVHMRRYSEAEIEAYVASGDPLDKAGGYAIQISGNSCGMGTTRQLSRLPPSGQTIRREVSPGMRVIRGTCASGPRLTSLLSLRAYGNLYRWD
ncbi:MAG: Maf family nucleotide pyrophosphatase [Chloroflexi bacterium]|nr:Maf family nucleotide pyrophosphatase [Chloroflexota bacterium]